MKHLNNKNRTPLSGFNRHNPLILQNLGGFRLFHRIAGIMALLISLFVIPVSGQIYVNTFTGTAACPTNGNIPTMASNATGTAVTRTTMTCQSTANVFNSTTLNVTSSVSNTSYIEFSATAAAGFKLNVTSLAFFRQASASAPNQMEVRYSLDGFTTFTSWGSAPVSPTTGTVATWDMADFSTATAGTVTFRIYPYGTTRADLGAGASSTGTFRIDDLTLNGTVTSAVSPTISTTGTLASVNTTYGTASSSPTSFSISGANLTANISLTAPTGYEISTAVGSGYATSLSLTQTGGTVASTTIYARLAATSTVAGSPYSGTISCTSAGATTVNVATVSSTVSPLNISTTGATAANKIYDGLTAATITGATALGAVNGDILTVVGGGIFASSNVANGIIVTPSLSLSGTNASSYTLTQPGGLTANITPKSLTITGLTADNKVVDGNTTATLSGTPSLVGVITADLSNVILGGSYTANFVSAAVGNGISVIVSGYTISGSASTNYSLTQPTGLTANITSTPSPVINSALTHSATYGTATSYFITGTNSPTSYNATGLPSGLSIVTSTGEINGSPTVIGTFNVTISADNAGGTGNATLVLTVGQKNLTVTGANADTKVYNGNTAATISGSILVGLVGLDVVTISTAGTFADANVANGIAVTSNQTLGGADAAKYTVTLPTGLSANITPANQNITFDALPNKTTADIDFAPGATSATSGINPITYISTNTAVATITLGGLIHIVGAGTTTIIASQAASQNYNTTSASQSLTVTDVPTLTEVIFPQFIQGVNGTNNNRLPFAYRASLTNLTPNATYRYFNGVELTTASLTSTGAGNSIYPDANVSNNFVYTTGPGLSTAGSYGTFTTDNNGAYTGWFIIAPSGNATRFVPGTNLYTRIALNNGAGGTAVTTVLSSTSTIKVINLVSAAGTNNGTGLRGNSFATAKNFIFVYDNTSGSGRPLSGTFVESDGAAEITSFATLYSANVDASAGAYGLVIPNTNTNGVRRVEQRDFTSGAIIGCPATDNDGVWPSGANTVSPIGGTTAIVLTTSDAALGAGCSASSSTTNITICDNQTPYTWNGQSISTSGTYTYTTTNYCGCDSIASLVLTINASSSNISTVTACDSYTWSVNGTTYTQSGTYTSTSTNAAGCPHTETLVLTINASTSNITTATACDSYTWSVNGTTYTQGGTYTVTSTNAAGCPHTETLVLTINASSSTSTTATACDSYTWSVNGTTYTQGGTYTSTSTNAAGCPHTETLNLTITPSSTNTTTITANSSYTWSVTGQTYTTSGIKTGTTTNCVTELLDLTITQTIFTGPSTSVGPYVLPVATGVTTTSMLTVPETVGGYKMVGIPDGLGAFDNNNGTFTLLMNHELGNTLGVVRAHGAKGAFVSKWIINKSNLSIVSGSDLITSVYGWNSTTQSQNSTPSTFAFQRFCSADLPPVSAYYNPYSGLGTQDRIFMHGEEGGTTGYQVATVASGADAGKAYILGKFNTSTNGSGLTGVGAWENALANPFTQDKTIVIGNNDGGTGVMNNSVCVYQGTKTNSGTAVDKAGLTNGTLKFVNVTGNPVEIVNTTTRATNITSGTAFTLSATSSTTFSRPEDGAWDPTDYSKYYFVTTDRLDQVADGIGTQIGRSRLWRLNFTDITNPDLGGTIDMLLDGTEGHNMLDNIGFDNYGHILLLEDVGGAAHNGKVWQYTIATDQIKLLAKHDPAKFGDIVSGVAQAATLPFNNDEETSGIIDMSDILGAGNFLLVDQAHYNVGDPEAVEGGQLLKLYNPDTYTAAQCATTSSQTQSACGSYPWAANGVTYTASGTYIYTSLNTAGCLNTATLNLTINNSTTSSTTATACDSYTWSVNGTTYTQSGTYTSTSTNAAGCPHTDTLVLTINASSSNITTVTACDSYTWSVNGTTYTQGGTYTSTSTNAAGCPHTETLNLTITPSSTNTTTITATNAYTWSVTGQTYTTSGIKIGTTTNCVTELLNLTIVPIVVNLSVSANAGSEAAGTIITVTATASAPVNGSQSVSLGVSGTGITAGDYTLSNSIITIPNGQTTGSVTFTVVNDVLVEGTETATLTISNPSSGITLGTPTTQNITITDNDIATVLTFVRSDTTALESAGTAKVFMRVTTAGNVAGSVNLAISSYSTATSGGTDYSVPITLNVPANTTVGQLLSFDFAINDDALAEADEYVICKTSGTVNVSVSGITQSTLYIKDNDKLAPMASNQLGLNFIGSFSNGAAGVNSAEISAYDSASKRIFIANSIANKLDIVNFANPTAPVLISSIDLSVAPFNGAINSVDVFNGKVALALEGLTNKQANGKVVFTDINGTYISEAAAGAMPDMITFNHAGTKVYTANEGEPNAAYTNDPVGSITVVDISGGIASPSASTIGFTAYNGQETALRSQGIRIYGVTQPGSVPSTAAQDFEPEYITISDDDSKAWVTLQENNALVELDLSNNTIVKLIPLGFKDHSNVNNPLDVSDQTFGINLSNFNIRGMYEPDAISQYTSGGNIYLLTANEGDSRAYTGFSEEVRVSALNLDPTVYPNSADLKNNAVLGRLTVTNKLGDIDNDGDIDQIYCLGGRSFSIWNPASVTPLVYDSKDDMERITSTSAAYSQFFNMSNTIANTAIKNRSDDKGPEPEGITTAKIGSRTYAFIGLERIGGAMVYDITNPASPVYVTYANSRTLAGGDRGAEGVVFIPASQSPNGKGLVILSNEISSTLSVFEVAPCSAPGIAAIANIGSTSVCAGSFVKLYNTDNSATYTRQWLKNGTVIPGATDSVYNATTSGSYRLVAFNSTGCVDTSAAIAVMINSSTANSTTATACDSYTWSVNGTTYTQGGTYTSTSTNASGCPHTETLVLTINSSTANSTTASACDSYTWSVNGTTYTQGGTYTSTSTNAAGCPHTETLVLTINASTTNSTTATACDSYTWSVNGTTYTQGGTYTSTSTNAAGCPHTETLVLTINASTTNITTATACDSYTWSVNGTTYTQGGTYISTSTNASGCPHADTLNLIINTCLATLNLKCFIQGYYVGSGIMNAALYNSGVGNSTTNCDSIVVELHNATSPQTIDYSFSGILQTDGTLTCTFPGSAIGHSYYIVLNHRNALQTWSANPELISTTSTYDFSTANAQSFGANQIEVEPNVWAMYSGDVNQDFAIDAFDYIFLDIDITNGQFGYLTTDLTGDGVVDAFDYILFDPNNTNGVTVVTP